MSSHWIEDVERGKTKSQTRTLCRGLSAPAAENCQGRNPKRFKCSHTKNTWEKQANENPDWPYFSSQRLCAHQGVLTLYQIASQKQSRKGMFSLLRDPGSQTEAAGRKTKQRSLLWQYLFCELVISSSTLNSLSPSPEPARFFTRSLCFLIILIITWVSR